jgi:hypothetical protein
MFGTDDVIYVPENTQLIFDDVYRWRRFKIDVRRLGVRMRTNAFEEVSGRIRGALALCRESPRFAESINQIAVNSELMVRDLAQVAGSLEEALHGSLQDVFRSESATWWVRVSDLPAESFFDEDYERQAESPAKAVPYLTYGRALIAQLDGLDIELPGDEAGLPFSLDVPEGDGLTRWTMPVGEPLALVREYCGARGASAYGHTMNLDTNAAIAEAHQFCTLIGRLGEKLFATLYFYYGTTQIAEIVEKLSDEELPEVQKLLEKSGFALRNEGPTWRIFERDGDVVHLYSGLAGKESEGVETMPHFVLVASAGGQFDPQQRAELLEAIRETMRAS